MSVVVDTEPKNADSVFNGVGGKTLFEFSVSGGEISNAGYRLQISIYDSTASTLLAGTFDYYKDSNDDIAANISSILKGLFDITSGEQTLKYRLKYQEVWDGGSNSIQTISTTYIAIFGYYSPQSKYYNRYLCEDGLTDKLYLSKIRRLWVYWPNTLSVLAGDNLSNDIDITYQILNSDDTVFFEETDSISTDLDIINLDVTTELFEEGEYPIPFTDFVNGEFDHPAVLTDWSSYESGGSTNWAYKGGVEWWIDITITGGDPSEESSIFYQEYELNNIGGGIVFDVRTGRFGTPGAGNLTFKIHGRKLNGTWDVLKSVDNTQFTSTSATGATTSIEITELTSIYDALGFSLVTHDQSAAGSINYNMFEISISEMYDNVVPEITKTALIECEVNSGLVISERFSIDHCEDGVMLKWYNSLGGFDQFLFNAPYDKSYEFDGAGNKYLRQVLYAEGLTQTEWDAMNDLIKEGELYEDSGGNRYRINHQVWEVDVDENLTPVIVLVDSPITRSNRPGNTFQIQIEYPKEILT